MFSKIKDLPRYKSDQKRFLLAIDSTYGEVKIQGQKLLSDLNSAVEAFDSVMEDLIKDNKSNKMDHARAQQMILETKTAIESWVSLNAPNVHVDEIN